MDEQQRGISLKMVPMSLVLEGSSGKSYIMNMVDTPGTPPPLPGLVPVRMAARQCLVPDRQGLACHLQDSNNACLVPETESIRLGLGYDESF